MKRKTMFFLSVVVLMLFVVIIAFLSHNRQDVDPVSGMVTATLVSVSPTKTETPPETSTLTNTLPPSTLSSGQIFNVTMFADAEKTNSAIGTEAVSRHYLYKSQTPVPASGSSSNETPPPATDYYVIYNDGKILVREKSLGWNPDMGWNKFPMPESRIENTVSDLGFVDYSSFFCLNREDVIDYHCKKTVEIHREDGSVDVYDFELIKRKTKWVEFIRLKKNGNILAWTLVNGGTGSDIQASRLIGGEIAFEFIYYHAIPGEFGLIGGLHSIIITDGESARDVLEGTQYSMAYAPFELEGELLYFASRDSEQVAVYGEQVIAWGYDSIFNSYCCWDGPRIKIISNGEIIDFFGTKNGGYYHVQIGSVDSFTD